MTLKKQTYRYPVWLLLAVIFGPRMEVLAQANTTSHTVSVQVGVITVLQVDIGTVNLSITGATIAAGQDQMSATDQSSRLLWGINSSGRKITAASNLAVPRYTLKLAAVNPTQGAAASEITLNAIPKDLLLSVGRSTGSCTLRYTGIALASQGTGSDSHLITFTVLAQ